MDTTKIEMIVFDLDGTLTESKAVLASDMAELLYKLLMVKKVAVISGASFGQFQKQFLTHLDCPLEQLANLFILPTNGTQLYMYDPNSGKLIEMYEDDLSEDDKKKIMAGFEETFKRTGFTPGQIYGTLIEDRKSQITFSGLGSEAPLELKALWDPDWGKRKTLQRVLITILPDYEIRIGGMTSIDITKKGFDKAYGLRRLSDYLHIEMQSILYVGDALFVGGNDSSVISLDIKTQSTAGPEETKRIIGEFL